jgi:RNA polymerase sigma-54 factor
MALRPSLQVRQIQQLTMTPQLRQAIAMLQMSSAELEAFLAAQIEANPLLSIEDGAGERRVPAPPEPGEPAPLGRELAEMSLKRLEAAPEAAENLWSSAEARPATASESWDAASAAAAPAGLAEHVLAQLALARLPPPARRVAEMLAHELDEVGYLRLDLAAAAARIGAPPEAAEAALAAIRDCEPTGVGARDLAECLALQLAERGRLVPAMRALLDNLALLPERPTGVMAALCGVTPAELRAMLAELRALDPRPGLRLSGGLAPPARPELAARPDGAGGWEARLIAEASPRLRVDRGYAEGMRAPARRGAGAFLNECARNADWLQRSLAQRARTLLAVGERIVRAQRAFLEQGPPALRPMTLRDVAEAVGVHESTVSRVAAGKYMATPQGVFELRWFFSAGAGATAGAESRSVRSVRERLRALIAAEPADRPHSDDRLVALLREEGVELARRTVAKYREELRIPSSPARRRRAASAVGAF